MDPMARGNIPSCAGGVYNCNIHKPGLVSKALNITTRQHLLCPSKRNLQLFRNSSGSQEPLLGQASAHYVPGHYSTALMLLLSSIPAVKATKQAPRPPSTLHCIYALLSMATAPRIEQPL